MRDRSAITDTTLPVSWGPAPGTRDTLYDLRYRRARAESWTDGPQGLTVRRATLTGLSPGTTYEIQVRARDDGGASEWSDRQCAYPWRTTTGTSSAAPPDVSCPAPDLAGRTKIWQATLRIGDVRNGGRIEYYGGGRSRLSDATFETLSYRKYSAYLIREVKLYGPAVNHPLYAANGYPSEGTLVFGLNRALDSFFRYGTAGQFGAMRLHVCDQSFRFSEADYSRRILHRYQWESSGLDWSAGATRTLYLSVNSNDCVAGDFGGCTVAVGGSGTGQLDPRSEYDAWSVTLEVGHTYVIDVKGADTSDGTLPDPVAKLFRPGRVLVAADDDGGTQDNARITYTVPVGAGGTYTIQAGSVLGFSADTAIHAGSVPPFTDDMFTYTVAVALKANNVPTASNEKVVTPPDTAYTFRAGDFGFEDADADSDLARVEVVTPPAKGTLALDGTAVTQGQSVARADIDARKLTYTPLTGERGGDYASFTFKVHDGADESASAYTMTIDVLVLMGEPRDCSDRADAACLLSTPGMAKGAINPSRDTDSWSVILAPDKTYRIDVKGAGDPGGDNGGTLGDPKVELYELMQDADRRLSGRTKQRTNDNASATNKNARITYEFTNKPQKPFHIRVSGVGGTAGSYTLSVVEQSSGQQRAPLTAALGNMPPGHDGATPFTVELRFSEAVAIDAASLRAALEVTGGSATAAAPITEGSTTAWRVTVTPGGTGAVTLRLPATTDCADEGAVCTSDGRGVSRGVSATVAGAPPPARLELTARFESVPEEHDGASAFTFELHFSEAPKGLSYRTMRGSFFDVTNGTVTKARRLAKGDNGAWRVTVEPDGLAEVIIGFLPALPADDCAEAAVVCTAGGTRLSAGAATYVPGPASLSVADATVREAPGATLDFVVRLSRARHEATTVDYATSDGTARAPDDYAHTEGTLTLDAGERERTVSVAVVDDSHDDGGETVMLALSNAGAPTRIADATATGTIENADPLPGAWLVRFGRTVGSQVLDALSERFDAPGRSHVTVGGVALRGGEAPAHERDSLTLAGWDAERERAGSERTLTLDELVAGTRFHLSSGAPEGAGAAYTAWGRVATGGFDAEVDDGTLDGDVTTALVGLDAEWESALAGVMLSQSSGDGGYRLSADTGDDAGTVKSTLTGVYPYGRIAFSPDVSGWALAGVGSGELTLHESGGKRMPADIEMRMGAVGVHAGLLDAGDAAGLVLALQSDAMWVSTKSEGTAELRPSEGDVTRLRLTVRGERPFALGGERTLTPSAEVGLRHDAGDAERGAGLELGAGLRYRAGAVTMQGRVRTLLAHAESGYEEWGASGSIEVAPGRGGRGLTLRVSPAWGATASAAERLWGARDAGALGLGGREFEAEGRLEGEVGYGIGLARNRGLVTPYTALRLGEGAARTWRAGARWRMTDDVRVGLEGVREQAGGDAPADAITLRAQVRF